MLDGYSSMAQAISNRYQPGEDNEENHRRILPSNLFINRVFRPVARAHDQTSAGQDNRDFNNGSRRNKNRRRDTGGNTNQEPFNFSLSGRRHSEAD
jgi:hypothetical protein